MKIKEALQWAKKELKEEVVAEPESSAEFLLAHALGLSRTELYANLGTEISSKNLKTFQKYLSKRIKHQPVWQIVGVVPFWGMEFVVNKNVLVPRPETEFLVKKVLTEIKDKNSKILDVGTGAGPIAVAIASEIKKISSKSKIYASDISPKALEVARKNAKKNGVKEQIMFKKSDLFHGWKRLKFDVICANLPYIPHEEMPTLALDIHHFEPRIALDGGKKGLEIYEEFFRQVPEYTSQNAIIFCEIGEKQAISIKKIIRKYLPTARIESEKDFRGVDRLITVRLTKK